MTTIYERKKIGNVKQHGSRSDFASGPCYIRHRKTDVRPG